MCINNFKETFENINKNIIPSNQFYSAHKYDGYFESLNAHSEKCSEYFQYIINEFGLEYIIDDLLISIFGKKYHEEAKQIISYGIFYHDIGKLNLNFQKVKVEGLESNKTTHHALFSDVVLSSFLIYKYPKLKSLTYLIVIIIKWHHTKLKNFTVHEYNESIEEKEIISEILKKININEIKFSEHDKRDFYRKSFKRSKNYEIFLLVKLLYSLLVLSDSYSTMHYTYSFDTMYSLKCINDEIKNKMTKSFLKIPYNSNIECSKLKGVSNCNNLNELRKEILIECDNNINKLLKEDNKIFMLSVPTGGGKTNISIKMALNILEHDKKINKMFYVFPFVNIIEQNYNVIDKTLFNDSLFNNKIGLISDIYSRAYIDKFHGGKFEESISNLEKSMVIRDDNFLNNCVNVITNVNFFNAFIKNSGNNRYKIVNMCNSVIVIDEIQTLSDKNLRVFYNFIKKTSEHLNIYYIIMSATLPNFNDFLDGVKVPHIIDNPQKYYNHPIFKRNEIVFRKDVNDIDGIKELLIEEINKNYRTGNVKILVTLNLVATSRKVYEELKCDEKFENFTFYLLNSTTSSLRRKKIIEEIKDKSKEVRTIIVSTQSIEAGVDIDCDFGIRDYSILDSIEQISGRINRECDAKKAGVSKLFVIKYKDGKLTDSEKIYGNQERYKILSKKMTNSDIKEILNNKLFSKYYKILSNELKNISKDSFNKINNEVSNLHYQTINNELNIIDDLNRTEQIDIFVFEKIKLKKLSIYDKNKIEGILDDINIKKIEKEHNIDIISNEKLNTEKIYNIWKIVLSSTNKFENVYLRRKITSLVNQFILSINNIKNKENDQDILNYLINNDYVKKTEFNIVTSTRSFSEFYSFDGGLRIDKLKEKINEEVIGIIF